MTQSGLTAHLASVQLCRVKQETEALWRWVGQICTDAKKTDWCKVGTNSGPEYGTIVNEDIVDELLAEKFGGGFGSGNATKLRKSGHYTTFMNGVQHILYVMPKVKKPDGQRGWMINLQARVPGPTWGTLRVNLHVHFRTAEKVAELAKKIPDADGWVTA